MRLNPTLLLGKALVAKDAREQGLRQGELLAEAGIFAGTSKYKLSDWLTLFAWRFN